jgi:DNA processing protein
MEIYFIWLSLFAGVSLRVQYALLQHYGDPRSIYTTLNSELQLFLQHIHSKSITINRDLKTAEITLEAHKRFSIKTLLYTDTHYRKLPQSALQKSVDSFAAEPGIVPLKRSHQLLPIVLFYRGKVQPSTVPVVGLIGSRKSTPYGKEAALRVCTDYNEQGYIIASRLSQGIDSIVHTAALKNGAVTYAFLPHGLDRCYPASQTKLMHQIAVQGCLISQYPAGKSPRTYQFVKRNELYCSWINELVVVGAGRTGGTLSTARYARKIGKKVYAVPQNIFSPESAGVNQLFSEGVFPYIPHNCALITTLLPTASPKIEVHDKSGNGKAFDTDDITQKLKVVPLSTCDLAVMLKTNSQSLEEQLTELELNADIAYKSDGKWHFLGAL